jgi:hypothetical protein
MYEAVHSLRPLNLIGGCARLLGCLDPSGHTDGSQQRSDGCHHGGTDARRSIHLKVSRPNGVRTSVVLALIVLALIVIVVVVEVGGEVRLRRRCRLRPVDDRHGAVLWLGETFEWSVADVTGRKLIDQP